MMTAFAAMMLAPPATAQQSGAGGADTRLLFSADDYPADALRKKEEGTARAKLTVGTDGRVKDCAIVESSNSPALDAATCNILVRRAKFTPARDSNGNPVEDTYVTPPISWRIDEDAAPAPPAMEQAGPGRYLCRTAAGHFAQQGIMPLQPGQEMRVAFRLNHDNESEQFPTLAVVYFEGPKGKSRIALGKARNDRLQMYVAVVPPGSTGQDAIFQYPLTAKWIILKLNLDKRGYLTIRSNDLTHRYEWGPVTKTYLHCNSGEWEIDVWPRSYVPAAPVAEGSAKTN
jgi:TonB family protein